jgi:lipopolysaccharide biosynthesis protein
LKAIAFYLPQFHPIPENDLWWGKGFTEWTNVVKAKPLYKGHYQPHLPADLGFYDLRLAEAREAQANLAREYGIHGFCFYHYWFNGRRLLERPVNEIVATGRPDFPFCLCWANENWSKRWDGSDDQILVRQVYSESDDTDHIRYLLPILSDPRYITVAGKPMLLVYRARRLPEPLTTTAIWRREAAKAGLPGLFLVRVESFVDETGDPRALGFDVALEFQPSWQLLNRMGKLQGRKWWHHRRLRTAEPAFARHSVYEYDCLVEASIAMIPPPYPFIRGVSPGFDNTSRCRNSGVILAGASPESYERWLSEVVVRNAHSSDTRGSSTEDFIFINAWNEWAEGNHLEPCQKWGRAYLEATRNALRGSPRTE